MGTKMNAKNSLDEVKAKYREAFRTTFEEQVKDLDDKGLQALKDRLARMIEYAISRVDYHENQRTTYQTIALAIIAFAAGLVAVLANQFEKIPWFVLLSFFISLGSLIAGGLRILYKYFRETSPNYPYRTVSDIKSWYFKYNLNYSGKLSDSECPEQLAELAKEHGNQFISYMKTWFPHASDLKNTILEDIEQVYILFALQHYKREFAKQMAKILKIHVMVFSIFLLIGLFALVVASIL
jgi:hypothetical protein